jgi:cytochrome P450
MLDSFIERGLTKDQALSEVSVVLASNTDNASSAAQAIIFCILSHPPVYEKLQQELQTATQSARITFPISETAVRALPYLQACIAEGLRRFPPEMQLRERMVPPEGDTLCGYTVPGGTYVGFNALASQNSKLYGKIPETFRPERWLVDDEEQVKQMHGTLELLFSHGSSKCLGVRLAYMEISKIVFEVCAIIVAAAVRGE